MTSRTSAREQLLAWRNTDGGWPYAPGKRTRVEPTCLALLALGETAVVPGEWLRQGGLLGDGPGLPANYAFNGLALLTLLDRDAGADRLDAVAHELLKAKGVAVEPSEDLRFDTQLRAWPWVSGTFSWVEPTAWCLLALKKWRAARSSTAADARIAEAERLLIDRTCEGGGWNYGNSVVFAKALAHYVPTTAIGLLALQDHPDEPAVGKSRDLLVKDAASEPSALAVGLAAIALSVLGLTAGQLDPLLEQRMDVAASLGQVAGFATALYALGREEHGCAAFKA